MRRRRRISAVLIPLTGAPLTGTGPYCAGLTSSAGDGTAGVNLMQAFLAVNYSNKVNDNFAWGVGPVFAVQMFEAKGVQTFTPITKSFVEDPAAVSARQTLSNNDADTSFGFGFAGRALVGHERHGQPGPRVPVQDVHERVRRLRGPVCRKRRLRYPVQHQGRAVVHGQRAAARQLRHRAHGVWRSRFDRQSHGEHVAAARRACHWPSGNGYRKLPWWRQRSRVSAGTT